jgi:hypothetical protein
VFVPIHTYARHSPWMTLGRHIGSKATARQARAKPNRRCACLGAAGPYRAPSSDVISVTLAFASPKSIWVFSP